jgi:hypothetical protein
MFNIVFCKKASKMGIYEKNLNWELENDLNSFVPITNKRPMGHIAHLSNLGQYRNIFFQY